MLSNKCLLRSRLFFPSLLFTHESRAVALYCLLTQTTHSLMVREKSADASQAPPRYAWQQMSASQPLVFPSLLFTHESRAVALYCLLTQTTHSLMVREKQMSASQPLVFPFTHYIPIFIKPQAVPSNETLLRGSTSLPTVPYSHRNARSHGNNGGLHLLPLLKSVYHVFSSGPSSYPGS